MKNQFFVLSLITAAALACDLTGVVTAPTNPAPAPTNTIPAASAVPTQVPASPTLPPSTAAPSATATSSSPSFSGVEVSVGALHVVLPPGLATGARGNQFPRAEGDNVAPWEVTPGHTQLQLEGYLIGGRSLEPQILVYPAQAYAEMFPGAFESIRRLDNIHGSPGTPISNEQLPTVPSFNAVQVFASDIQTMTFQNGWGVRFLTEYAQFAAPVNNHDLLYHFQGVTGDGAYYVIAVLPIASPLLAETSDAGAVLPAGGVPYLYYSDPNADMQGYYNSITALLNGASPQSFTPAINQLDLLIQSMRISP